ncbi:ABC transporter permease subunit [Mesorhizobium sp. M0047]|uniref:ABC transporter permease n=1 Tax=Mesorhizobium sp. M0047 TaxID=2956859 RepID=UPI00333CD2BE
MTSQSPFLTLLGFGTQGWGFALLHGSLATLGIAVASFLLGGIIGTIAAWAKIKGGRFVRWFASTFTTIFRGVPDLLVVYLFYFGSSSLVAPIARALGNPEVTTLPGFVAGILAIGIVSGAYQTEVLRAAFGTIRRGELEAATAAGMSTLLKFRRIIVPLTLRNAIPNLGNVWQFTLKDTALISVIGVVDTVRQAQMGAGATHRPFPFFIAAGIAFLLITTLSGFAFRRADAFFRKDGTRS